MPKTAGAKGYERRQGHGVRRPGVVQFDDVQVVIVVARLDRGADPVGVRLEVIEADLDRFLRRRVGAEAGCLQRAVARSHLGFEPVQAEMPGPPVATVCMTPGFSGPSGISDPPPCSGTLMNFSSIVSMSM